MYDEIENIDILDEDELMHYGMPRRSGRYPWGSGDEPFQHSGDFLSRYGELKKSGMSEADIAKYMGGLDGLGMSTTQLRAYYSIATNEQRALKVHTAEVLAEKGLSNPEIAKRMGLPGESSVRSLLNEASKNRMNKAAETAERLKDAVKNKGIIDIGAGVELDIGVSAEKMKIAEEILKAEGYEVYPFKVPQATNPGQYTTVKALCPPGTTYADAYKARDNAEIASIIDYESVANTYGGVTKKEPFVYPSSLDSSRLKIRYKDEAGPDGHTGVERDGVIELRRGVEDLNLGDSHYAQVRIMVDNSHYLKGMAVYSDNMPDGVDVIFNTNKKPSDSKLDALKKLKTDANGNIDKDNPFGSLIKEEGGQSYYTDKDGKKKLSLINKRAEEGDWGEWADHLPSQFLGKQDITLIQKQLKMSIENKQSELDEINSLTNPTVKKKLLYSFADDCDAAAVQLQAAALPRQKYQVILPLPGLKDNEIYAPNYTDGEMVSLVRFPHGGTFEIPQLRVNNNNKEGQRVIGKTALDAVGINSAVAERLSGADFDGDTVMVIPTNSKTKIISTPALKGLKGFDSKDYKCKMTEDEDGNKHLFRADGKEVKYMTNTQKEMGMVSNLITDMTLKGASPDELARAVKHSMVVIDAAKHGLDYKQSEIDNDIASLKNLYQNGGGASTVLSKAKGEFDVPKRKGSERINLKENASKNNPDKNDIWYDPSKPEGSLIYKTADPKDLYYTDRKYDKNTKMATVKTVDGKKFTYDYTDPEQRDKYEPVLQYDKKTKTARFTNKDGTLEYPVNTRTTKSTKMAETDDARTLLSKNPNSKEILYADYANTLKELAREARIEYSHTGKIKYDPQAKKQYAKEVQDLNDKLLVAEKNRPRERQAQILANSIVEAKKRDNPGMEKDELRKVKQKALTSSRIKVGAKKELIKITDNEWNAIQSGAISENTLYKIISNMDGTELKQRATPKTGNALSTTKIAQIKARVNSGYTTSQIADALGVSVSTVQKYMKESANK